MRQHYQKELESRLVIPTLQFLHRERSSGIVLGIFVFLALVLANSPFREAYTHFLEHHFGFSINGQTYLNFSLEHWINDGLMSMFFFVVGLELKREFIGGELRDLRKVTLPVVAALCGMLFPAAIYLIFNAGAETSQGWGIPMATDIAFALAVLQLLGNRVPMSAKVFLTTLAIVDDLGSVVILPFSFVLDFSRFSMEINLPHGRYLLLFFIPIINNVQAFLSFYALCTASQVANRQNRDGDYEIGRASCRERV